MWLPGALTLPAGGYANLSAHFRCRNGLFFRICSLDKELIRFRRL
jgi:hypothetical protein